MGINQYSGGYNINDKIEKARIHGADILIQTCARVAPDEKVLIIIDESTVQVGKYLLNSVKKFTDKVLILKTEKSNMHGNEPPSEIIHAMETADVIFGVTTFSFAHTSARMKATNRGARYLSLPDYNVDLLTRRSLRVNFGKQGIIAQKIKNVLDKSKQIEVFTRKGTHMVLKTNGRIANYCPGYCDRPGMLGSPPDIEVNISPLEDQSEGELIIDGSIPCAELGLIKQDVKVSIIKGMVQNIDRANDEGITFKSILDKYNSIKVKILAEFGIGLNPYAQLCGNMLEDEGCLGTIHFGFGSNSTVGGLNKVNFHIDTVIRSPSVKIDNLLMIKDGILQFKS